MGCLDAVSYDPASAVTKATDTLLAMTALDTTNLRITFTAPANGTVMVRLKGQVHGATTGARILFGVMDGATVKGRMSPMGSLFGTNAVTDQFAQECTFLVTGLTPSNSYTWDAAYGVELILASTALKYGGPNDTTGDNAFGAFQFEVWETTNLLAGTLYDPASAVTKSETALLAMTAMDTTNLRHTITAPASGKVFWRICTLHHGSATPGQVMLGIMESTTVRARTPPVEGSPYTASAANAALVYEASGVITGLTPSNNYVFDAAYGVEAVASAGGLKYGGPNNTTSNDAFGGIAYEIWAA
jgi:hypothetical protein